MPKSLERLLASATDSDLCYEVQKRILAYDGDFPDVSTIAEEERVVLLVLHVSGVVDNGGFRYLVVPHYR
jgi:hypothetical protein